MQISSAFGVAIRQEHRLAIGEPDGHTGIVRDQRVEAEGILHQVARAVGVRIGELPADERIGQFLYREVGRLPLGEGQGMGRVTDRNCRHEGSNGAGSGETSCKLGSTTQRSSQRTNYVAVSGDHPTDILRGCRRLRSFFKSACESCAPGAG